MSIPKYHIYCDLDGVLVDFEAGVRSVCEGQGTDSLDKKKMWSAIARNDTFFEHLPWTCDGKELWEAIHTLSPDILTGIPMIYPSRFHKFHWCIRELFHVDTIQHVDMAGQDMTHTNPDGIYIPRKRQRNKESHNNEDNHHDHYCSIAVDVITCWSRNKHMESKPGAILIDDRQDLGEAWESKGGIFIHHTSTANTLTVLRRLNVIP